MSGWWADQASDELALLIEDAYSGPHTIRAWVRKGWLTIQLGNPALPGQTFFREEFQMRVWPSEKGGPVFQGYFSGRPRPNGRPVQHPCYKGDSFFDALLETVTFAAKGWPGMVPVRELLEEISKGRPPGGGSRTYLDGPLNWLQIDSEETRLYLEDLGFRLTPARRIAGGFEWCLFVGQDMAAARLLSVFHSLPEGYRLLSLDGRTSVVGSFSEGLLRTLQVYLTSRPQMPEVVVLRRAYRTLYGG